MHELAWFECQAHQHEKQASPRRFHDAPGKKIFRSMFSAIGKVSASISYDVDRSSALNSIYPQELYQLERLGTQYTIP